MKNEGNEVGRKQFNGEQEENWKDKVGRATTTFYLPGTMVSFQLHQRSRYKKPRFVISAH